jgi:hypothetical protein
MRRVFNALKMAAAVVYVAALLPHANAADRVDVCKTPSVVTLSGKIHALQSMREEPEAEVETFFDLLLPSPVCGKLTVSASVIGVIPCREGETVTMTGEFSPPSRMLDTARLRGVRGHVDCKVAP